MFDRGLFFLALGLGCVVGTLASAAPAVAGQPPEQPLTEACSGPISGEGWPACGTLNPESDATVGYYFAYNVGSDCTGGAHTALSAEVEGESIEVSDSLSGLEPATTYSYCLVATNAFGETFGEPLTFETPPSTLPPEQPLTEACSGPISGEGWPVCGTLNPESDATVGYYFAYNVGSDCTGGTRTDLAAEVEGEGIEVSAVLTGLQPATTYSYCLVATNPFSEAFGGALAFRNSPLALPEPGAPAASGPLLTMPGTSTAPVVPAGSGMSSGMRERLIKRLRACRRESGKRRAMCRKRARTIYRRERNKLKAKAD